MTSTSLSRTAVTSGVSFPFPTDGQAWWNVSISTVAGWLLCFGPHLNLAGLALALAALCLFLGSEWLSHLAGRSRQGSVQPARLGEPLGLALLAGTAASLAWFLSEIDAAERQDWGCVMTGVGCIVAHMFILRLERQPLDGRLLYVTHLILTLPALMFGFVAWGVLSQRAFGFWCLPAAYFPAQALFSQYWMGGSDAPKAALSVLSAPVLAAILIKAAGGFWLGSGFLGLFLLWALVRLVQRGSSDSLPGFRLVKGLHWEIQAWNLGAVVAWALSLA